MPQPALLQDHQTVDKHAYLAELASRQRLGGGGKGVDGTVARITAGEGVSRFMIAGFIEVDEVVH